jgi:hypothetical protein
MAGGADPPEKIVARENYSRDIRNAATVLAWLLQVPPPAATIASFL